MAIHIAVLSTTPLVVAAYPYGHPTHCTLHRPPPNHPCTKVTATYLQGLTYYSHTGTKYTSARPYWLPRHFRKVLLLPHKYQVHLRTAVLQIPVQLLHLTKKVEKKVDENLSTKICRQKLCCQLKMALSTKN